MKRPGNNPKRRIAPSEFLTADQKASLIASVTYVASGHHKRNPADYGLQRTNPRPTKSLCDLVRIVPQQEAQELLRMGINYGMVSSHCFGDFPKFVWSVADDGEVYEAKTDAVTRGAYHGYRLEEDDDMRELVKEIWKQRCRVAGQ
jgi:hypothetical protein